MKVILLGPQGSGKGTQAQLLAKRTGARHISMGEIVRNEIRAGTPLGESIRRFADRGELVPDETVLRLVQPILQSEADWILDGFPRDQEQARALDGVLTEEDSPLDGVVALELPEEAVLERLSGRRQSESTGAIYHLVHNPPPPEDTGPFVVRADDEPHAIKRRIELYHAATEPLKQFYRERGVLTEIDAAGGINEVHDRLAAALGV